MTAPATVVQAKLGGGFQTLTSSTTAVEITRGRSGQIFESIDAGLATWRLNNEDRTFDPTYVDGVYYEQMRPGKSTEVRITSGGVRIYTGMLGDLDVDYEITGRTVTTFHCEDDLALLGRQEFNEWTATASQAAGARLAAVIARSEVNTLGSQSFDDGVSSLQGDLVSWGSNVLNYCQLVARSDLGFFFVARDGTVTFRDRHTLVDGVVQMIFTDGTAVLQDEDGATITTEAGDPIYVEGTPFHGVETSVGSELYYNRVGIDREGGTVQTATNTTNGATDGFRSLTQSGLLLDSDAQSLSMASFLLARYDEPETRVSSILVKLEGLTSDQQTSVLSLDIADLVLVAFTPNGVGDPVEKFCLVQGVSHSIAPSMHHVTLTFGDFQRYTVFTIDHPTFGEVDAGNVVGF